MIAILALMGAAPPPLRLSFGDDLHLPGDRVMRGQRAWETVVLPRPRAWELTGDPVVRISFSHADTLDPARSTLTLLLDDRPVASTHLGRDNAVTGELVATLPRAALQDYSRLGIAVTQREAQGCESPFAPGLWTRLGASSEVELPGRPVALPLQLLDFPAPLWDPLGTGPLRLTPVTTGPISGAALEAAGELAFGLGRIADYRGVEIQPAVSTLAAATTPAVVIGTPDENPAVAALLDPVELAPSEGLLALVANPDHPELAVLVITGGSGEGVRAAARALVRDDRVLRLAGSRARVQAPVESLPPGSARRPRPLRSEDATLASLGIEDHTAVGLFGAPLSVPLQLEGDSRARPNGARLNLHYAYGAGLDPRLSTLEVRVDGVGVRSVALGEADGFETTLRVRLPGDLVKPGSVVQVGFNLFPAGMAECGPPVDHQIWGTVYSDSVIQVERDLAAAMPDLGLLRHALWPFSAEGEGEHVAIVLADRPEGDDLAAGMQVAAALGARGVSTAAARLYPAGAAPKDGFVLVVASPDRPNTALHADERLPEPDRSNPHRWAGMLAESQPGGAGATRLALVAPEARLLLPLAARLTDDTVLHALSGARVAFSDDYVPHTLEAAGANWVRRGPLYRQLLARLQEHGVLLTVLALPGALVLARGVRLWARRTGGVT